MTSTAEHNLYNAFMHWLCMKIRIQKPPWTASVDGKKADKYLSRAVSFDKRHDFFHSFAGFVGNTFGWKPFPAYRRFLSDPPGKMDLVKLCAYLETEWASFMVAEIPPVNDIELAAIWRFAREDYLRECAEGLAQGTAPVDRPSGKNRRPKGSKKKRPERVRRRCQAAEESGEPRLPAGDEGETGCF